MCECKENECCMERNSIHVETIHVSYRLEKGGYEIFATKDSRDGSVSVYPLGGADVFVFKKSNRETLRNIGELIKAAADL